MLQIQQKLRVVMLGGYPTNPNKIRGGVQAACQSLANGLSRINNLELHIITIQKSEQSFPESINRNGVVFHAVPTYPRFERLRGYRNYSSAINDRLEDIQPHLIHVQEAAADALVALRTGYPTVITIHGIKNEDCKYIRALGTRLRFYFDNFFIERFVIRNAKYVVAISEYVTRYFNSQFHPDLRYFYIPNAVDARFFELCGYDSQPVVLFAGKVTPLKRVLDLVKAFQKVVKKIPFVRLHIAGDFHSDKEYVKAVIEFLRLAGLESKVYMLGELEQDRILEQFALCSLVVLPSAQENAPMVIAQAMAAGKPVVATRVGGVVEMIGDDGHRGMLIPVGDIDGLAEAIIRLLSDQNRCLQIGETNRKFAWSHYHPDVVAGRTAGVYREIVARETLSHG